jgi:thiol-disulfide isomerase/thioredoxin
MKRERRALVIFLGLGLGACATTAAPGGSSDATPASVGTRLPRLPLRGFDGRELRSDDMGGKVVLVDLWASWCAPCKEELPLLDDMARRLESKGIVMLAVSVDEDRRAALAFLEQRKRWSIRLAHDPESRVADALRPAKMPTSYIVDRAGVVRYVNAGFDRADAANIERRLVALATGE